MPARTLLTAGEITRLEAALGDAVAHAAKPREVDRKLFFQFLALRDNPAAAIPELRVLHDLLQSTPALSVFHHTEQISVGICEQVDHVFLARWLISRGNEVGPSTAVTDLEKYLGTEEIEVHEVLMVDGFRLREPVRIGEFELLPWGYFPDTESKWEVAARAIHNGRVPDSVIRRTLRVSCEHLPRLTGLGRALPSAVDQMGEVINCITAVIETGHRRLWHWVEPPDWAPRRIRQMRFTVDENAFPAGIELSGGAIAQVQGCWDKLRAMTVLQRDRFQVPLDRLNRSYLSRVRPIDSIIELGIALESAFIHGKTATGHLSRTLRNRAAMLNGKSGKERREIEHLVGDVYDLRSRAVHAGRFDGSGSSLRWRDVNLVDQTITEGRTLLGKSVVKLILDGEPKW